MILNLTQHPASPEQIAAGVIYAPDQDRLSRLLTFDTLPTAGEVVERAFALAALATAAGATSAMIGGAPFLMAPLEHALQLAGIEPVYAFSRRESVEAVQPDGTTRKTAIFRHAGFVPACLRARP